MAGAVGLHRASHRHCHQACKPGSVPRSAWERGDGHSSRMPVARHLLRPTRAAHLETRLAVFWAAAPPLFGLAPGGVCRAVPVARTAVRSYRTLSPLPRCLVADGAGAVCFLWHCPWGRPRRRLSGTVLPRSPDFPPCLPIRWLLAERPSGLLTEVIRGLPGVASSWPKGQAGQALNARPAMTRRSRSASSPVANW